MFHFQESENSLSKVNFLTENSEIEMKSKKRKHVDSSNEIEFKNNKV